MYSDADFAGFDETSESTSGIFLAATGPNSFFPLNGISKKQSNVSHSTSEAEIVSVSASLRMEALPALQLWDVILSRETKATLMEDNQATLMEDYQNREEPDSSSRSSHSPREPGVDQ